MHTDPHPGVPLRRQGGALIVTHLASWRIHRILAWLAAPEVRGSYREGIVRASGPPFEEEGLGLEDVIRRGEPGDERARDALRRAIYHDARYLLAL